MDGYLAAQQAEGVISSEIAATGAVALGGVAVGFLLQELSARWRRRSDARDELHALWIEIADVDSMLVPYLRDGEHVPPPHAVDFRFRTLEQSAARLRIALGHLGLNFVARMLGRADVRFGESLRLMSQARIQGQVVEDETKTLVDTQLRGFRADLIEAGKFIDAQMRLTPGFWFRHPRRAMAARGRVRDVLRAEQQREERARAPLPRPDAET